MGVLIVEDLIAILLITVLTTLSSGGDLSLTELVIDAGRLFGFLAALIVVGLFTVPRLMRYVVSLERPETTVVAAVGLAFGVALLAMAMDYSVALGAFIAGSLVAESGVAHRVEHLVQPVRDIFAAIFFVSVGMLIDPTMIVAHPGVSLAYLVVVVVGMVLSVSVGAILTGHSVQTSVRTGMSMAQIGEFSFIIAGLGMLNPEVAKTPLYAIAVAVSAVTTLLTPWFIRWAEPVAKFVDRKLPRPLQTFVALYGSWIEHMRSDTQDDVEISRHAPPGALAGRRRDRRGRNRDRSIPRAEYDRRGAGGTTADLQPSGDVRRRGAAIAVSSPFWIGMIRTARFLGQELANRAFPTVGAGRLDTADAPRRLLVVTLQLLIVMAVGAPLRGNHATLCAGTARRGDPVSIDGTASDLVLAQRHQPARPRPRRRTSGCGILGATIARRAGRRPAKNLCRTGGRARRPRLARTGYAAAGQSGRGQDAGARSICGD